MPEWLVTSTLSLRLFNGNLRCPFHAKNLAEAFNLPVTSHGAHDVTVHLLAAVSNRSYLEAHSFGLDRYIAEPLAIEDGFAVAPDRPGHGISFDWEALNDIRP